MGEEAVAAEIVPSVSINGKEHFPVGSQTVKVLAHIEMSRNSKCLTYIIKMQRSVM